MFTCLKRRVTLTHDIICQSRIEGRSIVNKTSLYYTCFFHLEFLKTSIITKHETGSKATLKFTLHRHIITQSCDNLAWKIIQFVWRVTLDTCYACLCSFKFCTNLIINNPLLSIILEENCLRHISILFNCSLLLRIISLDQKYSDSLCFGIQNPYWMAINTCKMKLFAQTGVGASLLLHTSAIVVVGDIQSFSIPFFHYWPICYNKCSLLFMWLVG